MFVHSLSLGQILLVKVECRKKVLVARICNRRTDPVTGKIYNLKFKPPPAEVAGRLTQRKDDTEDALKTRLEEFHANVKAVETAFAAQTVRIDGTQPFDHVTSAVLGACNSAHISQEEPNSKRTKLDNHAVTGQAGLGHVAISDDEAVELLCHYLRFETVSGTGHLTGANTKAVEFLAEIALRIGLKVNILDGPEGTGPRPVLVVTWEGANPSIGAVLLNSHYDVVPVIDKYWTQPPWDGLKVPPPAPLIPRII